eukprot:scaffold51304_cov59-Attheya_sp.AAC.4
MKERSGRNKSETVGCYPISVFLSFALAKQIVNLPQTCHRVALYGIELPIRGFRNATVAGCPTTEQQEQMKNPETLPLSPDLVDGSRLTVSQGNVWRGSVSRDNLTTHLSEFGVWAVQ